MYLKGTRVTTFTCPSGGPFAVVGLNTAGMGVGDCLAAGGVKAAGPQDGDVLITANNGHVLVVPISCICNNPEGVGINDSQIVLVLFQDELGNPQIGTYNLKTLAFTQLNPPEEPDPHPWSWGINNAGDIVIQSINPASGLIDSFLYSGGAYQQVNVPGALSPTRTASTTTATSSTPSSTPTRGATALFIWRATVSSMSSTTPMGPASPRRTVSTTRSSAKPALSCD